jgi:hypothetical protein
MIKKSQGLGSAPSAAHGTIPKIMMAMKPKHAQSMEIHQKSLDVNLQISCDHNLEFNM